MRHSILHRTHAASLLLVPLTFGLAGCAVGPYGKTGEPLPRLGDEIVVCGQLYHTGAPVVLWMDYDGYDAYRVERHFGSPAARPNKAGNAASRPGRGANAASQPGPGPDATSQPGPGANTGSQPATAAASRPGKDDDENKPRYHTLRRGLSDADREEVQAHGWSLPLLQKYVDLFVMHYDVCGTSRRCFEVLHDLRGLSVHFMLDVDGTIYQTLDCKERAWHAGEANDRSVGVEIANIGAYPDMKTLDKWYAHDEDGWPYITFPESLSPLGIRTPDFVARPARAEVVEGAIHGKPLMQYDLTDEQYDSLSKLVATLHVALPGIELDCPRDADGNVRMNALSPEELREFHGVLGHWHITEDKVDPGPAFDWDRVLGGARSQLR